MIILNKIIIAVFKTIAIFIIATVFLTMAFTTFTIFMTYSKMENVAYMMQGELSRNNRLLGSTTVGGASIDYYAKQLDDICKQTVARNNSGGQIVVLDYITIVEANNNSITYQLPDGATGCTITTNGYTEPADRADIVGNYGDVKKIEIHYTTHFLTAVVNNGTANITMEQLDGTTGTQHTLTVYAPCLRYIK